LNIIFQIPTQKSLEAEELERKKQESMRRQKLKEKMEMKKERLEMEQAAKEVHLWWFNYKCIISYF